MPYNFTYQSGSKSVYVNNDDNTFTTSLSVKTPILVSNSYVNVPLSPVTQLNLHPVEVGTINNQSKSYYSITNEIDLASTLRTYCFNPSFDNTGNVTQTFKIVSGSSYTLTAQDYSVVFNMSSSNVDFNLLDASIVTGQVFNIKRSGSGLSNLNILPSGSQLIDSYSSKTLSAPDDSIAIQSLGTKWIII